ncbi:MAG TPA: hypothetical protein VFL66_10360 [Gaiellaceae bacterium]|nr:hypothetical protein [Gaiellaceae bacterium]
MRRGYAVVLLAGVAVQLAFVLPLALGGESARSGAAVAGGARFRGLTSQKKPIALRLSADRREIDRIDVTYVAQCLGGSISMQLADTIHTPVAIRSDGSFSAHALGSRLSLRGRMAKGRSHGTLTIEMNYGGFMSCRTHRLRWQAARRS